MGICDIRRIAEQAASYYMKDNFYCVEAILKAVAEGFEMKIGKDIFSMTKGMHMGIGGQGCICGALSGAVMAVGLLLGQAKEDTQQDKVMEMSKELYQYFEENYEFFCCRTIIRSFEKGSNAQREHCAGIIRDITQRACELLTSIT